MKSQRFDCTIRHWNYCKASCAEECDRLYICTVRMPTTPQTSSASRHHPCVCPELRSSPALVWLRRGQVTWPASRLGAQPLRRVRGRVTFRLHGKNCLRSLFARATAETVGLSVRIARSQKHFYESSFVGGTEEYQWAYYLLREFFCSRVECD
jgi:hypothetical protein